MFSYTLPATGRVRDFHPLDFAHAGRTKEKATFYAKNIAFVNENDTYYHAYGCPHLDLEANWYPIRLNTPEANGCRPCGECEENN